MSGTTNIDWCDATDKILTWNCTAVSPGCDLCFARVHTDRYHGKGAFESRPPALRMHRALLPWTDREYREAYRIFATSMSDPFHHAVAIEDLAFMFARMAADWRHVWLVPTKRHILLYHRLTRPEFPALMARQLEGRLRQIAAGNRRLTPVPRQILGDIDSALERADWPLPNVMLGVSAEDRRWWRRRVPYLVKTPAAARMVSVEPLLHQVGPVDLAGGHWVIAGGESGSGHRPMDLDWVRELRDQCLDQGVAFWFKQIGGSYPGQRGDLLDGRQWKQHYEGMSA